MPSLRIGVAAALAAGLALPAAAHAAWSTATLPGHAALSRTSAAVAADGDAVVAWTDARGVVRAVTRRGTGAFSRRARVLARPGQDRAFGVTAALGPRGDGAIAWAQVAARSPRYRIMAATVRDGRIGRPSRIGSATSARRAQPRVVVAARGRTTIGWRRDDVPLQFVQRDRRGRFTSPRTPLRMPLADPAWDVAPDGRLRIAWTADGPEGPFVAVARGSLDGRWTRQQAVPAPLGGAARLEVAPNGTAVLALVGGRVDDDAVTRGPVLAASSAPGRTFFDPPQTLTAPGQSGWDLGLAVGPRAQAALAWGGSDGAPADPAASVAWVASRAAGRPFAAAQAVAAPGAWAPRPAVAVDGAVTAAVVTAGAESCALELRRGAAGAPLAPASLRATAPRRGDAHLAWCGASAAAAGRHTLVVWARGPDGPLVAHAWR